MSNDSLDSPVRTTPIALPGGWSGRVLVECHISSPDGTGGIVLPEYEDWRPWLERLVTDSGSLPDYSVLKYSKTNEVCRARITWNNGAHDHRLDAVCKRTRVAGFGGALASRLRPSRARRNFDRAERLIRAGIGTAIPLAMLEHRSHPTEAWLVTEFLGDVVDLDLIALTLLSQLDPTRSAKSKSALVDAVVELFARLAELNLHHRDLKASNILIADWDRPDRKPRPILVDLDGLRGRRWWRPSERRQPLIRLAASLLDYATVGRTDQARFLRRHLARGGHTRDDWKEHFRDLSRRAIRYSQRAQLRKGRKLDGHAGARLRT